MPNIKSATRKYYSIQYCRTFRFEFNFYPENHLYHVQTYIPFINFLNTPNFPDNTSTSLPTDNWKQTYQYISLATSLKASSFISYLTFQRYILSKK